MFGHMVWTYGSHIVGLLMGTPGDGVLVPAFYLAGPCGHSVIATVGDEPSSGLAVADPRERGGQG